MRHCYLTLLLYGAATTLYGQSNSSKPKLDFFEASVVKHCVCLPTEVGAAFSGLGFYVGVGKSIWKDRKRLNTKLYGTFTGYRQKNLHYGWELNAALLAQYRVFSSLFLEGAVGFGYLHTFEDAPIYRKKADGFKQVRDWGRPQATPNASFGLAFPILHKMALVTHYKFLLQLPFARKAGILFIPHSRISFGARIQINQ